MALQSDSSFSPDSDCYYQYIITIVPLRTRGRKNGQPHTRHPRVRGNDEYKSPTVHPSLRVPLRRRCRFGIPRSQLAFQRARCPRGRPPRRAQRLRRQVPSLRLDFGDYWDRVVIARTTRDAARPSTMRMNLPLSFDAFQRLQSVFAGPYPLTHRRATSTIAMRKRMLLRTRRLSTRPRPRLLGKWG